MNEKWQYHIEQFDGIPDTLMATLDKLGADGWELVQFMGPAFRNMFLFKRRIMAKGAAQTNFGG